MDRKYAVGLFILICAGLTVLYLHNRQKSDAGLFVVDPVKFVYSPNGAPGVAAVISGRQVTDAELLSRSPVLVDLKLRESKMLAEAALKFSQGKEGEPELELFMSDPGRGFKQALDKLHLAVKFEFTDDKPGLNVARLNGTAMNRDELALNQVHYSELKSMEFKEKLTVLKNLLVQQILLKAAEAEKANIEDYSRKNIFHGEVTVSDQELSDFISQHGIPLDKNAKKAQSEQNRLRLIVLEEKRDTAINAYIRANFDEKGTIFFLPPLYTFPVNGDKLLMTKGDRTALPVLVFTNLQCEPCQALAKELLTLKGKYSQGIRIGFVNLFPPEDWHSELAAEAGFCLNAQDGGYFWKFYELIASSKPPIDEAGIYDLVKKTGAKFEPFRQCLVLQKYKQTVTDQLKYAHDFGIVTLPTVIIGSNVLTGPVKMEDMDQVLASRVPTGVLSWLKSKL